MAYRIMKSLISNGTKTNEKLMEMADVYYAAGRLSNEQYTDIINMINKRNYEL